MESKKIAILGSSPISLFEALYQAKLGNKVVILSKDKDVGGAWKSVSVADGSEFEIGCHIWDVDKKTYQFLEDFIGEKLETLSPTPSIIFKNMTFPYDWKHNPLVVKAMKQGYLSVMTRKKFIKPQIIPRKYKYPKGGSKQLVDVLKEKVSDLNVEIKLDTNAERIEINEDSCILKVNNELVKFDEIVVTSFADIHKITNNGSSTLR